MRLAEFSLSEYLLVFATVTVVYCYVSGPRHYIMCSFVCHAARFIDYLLAVYCTAGRRNSTVIAHHVIIGQRPRPLHG